MLLIERRLMRANMTTETVERRAYSVAEFCASYNVSKSTFYKMARNGTGPRLMRVGERTLVSVEAADEWRRRLESEAA